MQVSSGFLSLPLKEDPLYHVPTDNLNLVFDYLSKIEQIAFGNTGKFFFFARNVHIEYQLKRIISFVNVIPDNMGNNENKMRVIKLKSGELLVDETQGDQRKKNQDKISAYRAELVDYLDHLTLSGLEKIKRIRPVPFELGFSKIQSDFDRYEKSFKRLGPNDLKAKRLLFADIIDESSFESIPNYFNKAIQIVKNDKASSVVEYVFNGLIRDTLDHFTEKCLRTKNIPYLAKLLVDILPFIDIEPNLREIFNSAVLKLIKGENINITLKIMENYSQQANLVKYHVHKLEFVLTLIDLNKQVEAKKITELCSVKNWFGPYQDDVIKEKTFDKSKRSMLEKA